MTKIEMVERVLIVRHCAHKDMYDDGGYCENKVRKYGSIYWAGVRDGNGELMCAECMLNCLIRQLIDGGCIPKFEDRWEQEFEATKALGVANDKTAN